MVTPAILTGTKPGMKVRDEEVFGPVVAIEPYDDFEQRWPTVNHSKYGLQAGLLTRDAGRISPLYRELEVGALIVGDTPSWRLDPMPSGGGGQKEVFGKLGFPGEGGGGPPKIFFRFRGPSEE